MGDIRSLNYFAQDHQGRLCGFYVPGQEVDYIHLHPALSSDVREKVHEMTYRQLDGLDWSNIFVAGGMVLGTLLSVEEMDAPSAADQWKGSDIDIYIYGLHPAAANEKVCLIYEVFRANLPANAPYLVIGNSKEISFLTSYPNRIVQIILKKVRHPKGAPRAIGYDGKEVSVLHRMVRALESTQVSLRDTDD